MDGLRKFLGLDDESAKRETRTADQGSDNNNNPGNNKTFDQFRKPSFFDDSADSDDELFDRQSFLNLFAGRPEIQKQIEAQVLEILKQFEETADFGAKPAMRDEEVRTDDVRKAFDEAAPSSSPLMSSSPRFREQPKTKKASDEERVMDLIHGSVVPKEEAPPTIRLHIPHLPPGHPEIQVSVFQRAGTGRDTKVTQTVTVRRPDGVRNRGQLGSHSLTFSWHCRRSRQRKRFGIRMGTHRRRSVRRRRTARRRPIPLRMDRNSGCRIRHQCRRSPRFLRRQPVGL